jgi:histone arginine demethylase JMJD6
VYVQYLLSELNDKGDWSSLGYADNFDSFVTVSDNVERIHVKDFPPSEFIEKYEKLYKPVVICGIQDNWKAKHKWTLEVRRLHSVDALCTI